MMDLGNYHTCILSSFGRKIKKEDSFYDTL